MDTDFDTVGSRDGIERLQEILIGRNQRLIPVVAGGQLAGIITRTGFLRYLHDMRDLEQPGSAEDVPSEGYLERRKVVASLMRERLPERVLTLLRVAGETAERLGMKAYAVGGFV